ncbi:MAG: hypothetical protein J5972_02160 [Eubacterium sp.]|nr:hypothetical protein [Eubacterium sp.]
MNINCNAVRRKKEQIEKALEQVCIMEKKFPAGELQCSKDGRRYKWFLKNERGSSYLTKDNRKLAEILALKKYYAYKKQDLSRELSACNAYLKKIKSENKSEKMLSHPEYGRLLEKHFISKNVELQKWQSEDYERSDLYKENLVIKGTQGKMVRSKSEAIIDMMLYQNKIPFRYEEKIVLDGGVLYPDFVIRHPVTGEYFYWEHFGMMDEEDYLNHACDKIKRYSQNGIIPSINLIMTFETKEQPLSAEKVDFIIQEYFGK